jgi:predicted RNA-binding protein YlqC (UPF0109 family)
VQELIKTVAQGLGIKPEDLSVEESQAEGETTLSVTLPLSGVQALDGREHRTAKALRLLLSAAAAAKGTRLNVVARAKD